MHMISNMYIIGKKTRGKYSKILTGLLYGRIMFFKAMHYFPNSL